MSYFCFVFKGLLDNPLAVDLELRLLLDFDFTLFGPLSLLFLTNLQACSLEKQSQIPSHAIIMKSKSAFIGIFLMSGNELT